MPHRRRAALASRFPVHVTIRVVAGLPSLRGRAEMKAITAAFQKAADRNGFRLAHYAVLGNHAHLIVEARDRGALSGGMKGLVVRLARGLNRLWARTGRVFGDRFHAHVLRTPREVRHALAYVFHNARRHGFRLRRGEHDPCSSARWFDGWRGLVRHVLPPPHLARARTCLLRVGWRRSGLLPLTP